MSAPKISIPQTPPSPLPPALRNSINSALLTTGSIHTIHNALLHQCQASGWLEAVRKRALQLFRSGECTSFAECMGVVMGEVKGSEGRRRGEAGVKEEKGGKEDDDDDSGVGKGAVKVNGNGNGDGGGGGLHANGVNSTAAEGGEGSDEKVNVRLPGTVVVEGVKIVREVLQEIVDIVVEEEA